MKKLSGKKLHLPSAIFFTLLTFVAACLVFFSSCSHISDDSDNLQLIKLSQLLKQSQLAETSDGKYLLKGNLSSSNGYESGRSVAVPSSDSSDLIKNYKVTALCGTEAVDATVKSVLSGGKTVWTYEVALHPGSWTISASAHSSETQLNESTMIFSGSTSVTIESKKVTGSQQVSLYPVRLTGQSGTVEIPVTSYSGSGFCVAEWSENGTSKSQNITFSSNKGVFTMSEDGSAAPVTCGSYLVTFIFFDDEASMNHVYTFVQRVNVYANLKTSAIVNAGPGENFIANGEIKIDSSVASTPAKSYFIDGTNGKDTNDGSYYAPFKTVQKAVNKIMKINDGTSTYSVYLLSDVTAGSLDSDFTQTVITDSSAYCEDFQLNDSSYNPGKSFVNINPSTSLKLNIQSYDSTSVRKIDGSGKGRVLYLNEKTSLTLQNVQISGGTTSTCGGGILCLGNLVLEAGATVKNNDCAEGVFGESQRVYGAGINVSGNKAVLTLNDGSSVTGNGNTDKNLSGGGIAIQKDTKFLMRSGATVSENNAKWGGGISFMSGSSTTISGGTVSGNNARITGGGIWNRAVKDYGGLTPAKFSSVTISENHARGGGGIYNRGDVTLTVCSITGNQADVDSDNTIGGGILCNGGTVNLSNGTGITGNSSAGNGGGIAVASENDNSEIKFIGATIVSGNSAISDGSDLYIKNGVVDGSPKISTVTLSAGEIKNESAPEKMIYMDSGILNLSGSPVLGGSINLNEGAAVTVIGTLTPSEQITLTPVTYEEDAVVIKGTQALVAANYSKFTVTPQQIEGSATAKVWLISDTGTLMSDSPRVGSLLLENGELKNPQLLQAGDTAVAVLIYDKDLTPSDTASQELNTFITGSTDSKVKSIQRIYMALESSSTKWSDVINGDYGACVAYNALKASATKTGLKGWSIVRKNTGAHADVPADWFPSYNYLLNYRSSEAAYNSQWYMPSLCELKVISENKTAIEKALTAAGKSAFSAGDYYWSCTNVDTGSYTNMDMENLNIASGTSSNNKNRYNFEYKVLPLLALDENGETVCGTADYFVDPVNGDDANSGISIKKAFRTLDSDTSIAKVPSSSSVCLLGNVTLTGNATLKNNLTIYGKSYEPDSYMTIDGNGNYRINTQTVNLRCLNIKSMPYVMVSGNNSSVETSAIFTHCKIENCHPITTGQGGVYVAPGGYLVAEYVNFEGNSADNGGALFVSGTAEVYHSSFTGNTAKNGGGAVYVYGGKLTLGSSTFSKNTAGTKGGAIFITNNGEMELKSGVYSDGSNTASFGNGMNVDSGITISGDVCFHQNDDVNLATSCKITVSGVLNPSTGITAFITSDNPTANKNILSGDVTLQDSAGVPNYKKFIITNEGFELSSQGQLQNSTSSISLTKTVSPDELLSYLGELYNAGTDGLTYTIKVTSTLNLTMLNSTGEYKLKNKIVPLKEKGINIKLDLSSSGLSSIPQNAFGWNASPDIAANAENICTNLTGCILPSGLTALYGSSFSYTGITEITIPSTVTNINGYPFTGCASLETVTVECSKTPDFSGCAALKNVTLANGVTTITNGAFSNCEKLETMTIPSTVTTITMNAFSGCTALKKVIFEDPSGWKAGTTSVDFSNSEANAVILRDTTNITWTKS